MTIPATWAHVIDIETMDTRPSARVLSIGVAIVHLPTLELRSSRHIPLSIADQPFRTQSDATMAWWRRQSVAARSAAFTEGGRASVAEAVSELHRWFGTFDGPYGVWGYGASFDLVVLEDLARDAGMEMPWSYRRHRDLRTLYELAGVDLAEFRSDEDIAHHAEHDARAEALALIGAMTRLVVMRTEDTAHAACVEAAS